MIKRGSSLLIVILLCSLSYAETWFADDFEISGTTWDGQSDSISLIDSPTGAYGVWEGIWPNTQTSARHGEVSASYGHTGKGFRFSMDSSGGTTQESNMFGDYEGGSEPQWEATTVFWGFWHRMDQVISQSVPLKMTRFYSGGNSVIPEWMGSQWNFFYNSSNHLVSTGSFELTDTDWHKYVMEFQRGNNSNDGVIRMWVDDSLVFEDTAVDWGDTGTVFSYVSFPMIQGNMSGSYSGGTMNTFFDDFIFASTKTEVETFLGGEASGTSSFVGAGTSTTFEAGTSTVIN